MKRSFKYHWIFILLPILLVSANSFGQVKQVEAVGMTVRDMDKSISFYSKVLSFEKINDETSGNPSVRKVRMKIGQETIELTQYLSLHGRSIPADMKSNDLYFQHIAIVVSDMDKAYEVLKKNMTGHISPMPETIPQSNVAAAGIRAYYFHDIDNHDLELIYFPQGKGQPKWQQTNGKLFLGIDHTAIGIGSTEKSLHFYQDILGMERKGDSWNKGMEQMLWDAACSIRGEKDAPKFKDYILPLLFIKRLSDVFDDEIQRLGETYGDRKTALEVLEADHSLVRFYIPPEARWP